MLTLLFRRGLIGLKKPDRYLQLRFRVSQGISERVGSERPTEKHLDWNKYLLSTTHQYEYKYTHPGLKKNFGVVYRESS